MAAQLMYTTSNCLHTRVARMLEVPAYVAFSDATLMDICRKRPRA